MNKVIEKFKENKKIMMIKMEQANKLAEDAAEEFMSSIESLVKDASEEDIKALLDEKDDMIDAMDKIAVVTAFVDSHENYEGIAIVGLK